MSTETADGVSYEIRIGRDYSNQSLAWIRDKATVIAGAGI